MRRFAALISGALVALVAGCGGGSASSDPRDVLACVTSAGLEARLQSVPDPGPEDPATYLYAKADGGVIAIEFFASPSALAGFLDAQGQAAANGSRNESQETGRETAVTIQSGDISDEQRDLVLGCL